MNPAQILMNQLQNQLKSKNPQLFQQFQNLKQSQSNPKEIIDKMIGNYTPEQIQQFMQFAHGFGINDEQLSKFGISSKKS